MRLAGEIPPALAVALDRAGAAQRQAVEVGEDEPLPPVIRRRPAVRPVRRKQHPIHKKDEAGLARPGERGRGDGERAVGRHRDDGRLHGAGRPPRRPERLGVVRRAVAHRTKRPDVEHALLRLGRDDRVRGDNARRLRLLVRRWDRRGGHHRAATPVLPASSATAAMRLLVDMVPSMDTETTQWQKHKRHHHQQPRQAQPRRSSSHGRRQTRKTAALLQETGGQKRHSLAKSLKAKIVSMRAWRRRRRVRYTCELVISCLLALESGRERLEVETSAPSCSCGDEWDGEDGHEKSDTCPKPRK